MKAKAGDSGPLFSPNDNCLCFHGPLMYEAKVLEVENTPENGVRYFIHYNGWNKNWREWVDPSRVLQMNEENLKKQKELQQLNNKKRVRGRKDSTKEEDGKKKSKKKHRGDGTVETEEDFTSRIEIRLPILEELRRQLVDDWDLVTTQKKLVPLPRDPNVTKILQDYKKSKAKGPYSEDVVTEVVDGLKVYFDQALGTLLLYKFERPQYEQILQQHPDADMSDIYGAEHLLRLFVKLPTLLAHSNMDEESLQVLIDNLTDFMQYMVGQYNSIFLQEYEPVTPEYLKQAQ